MGLEPAATDFDDAHLPQSSSYVDGRSYQLSHFPYILLALSCLVTRNEESVLVIDLCSQQKYSSQCGLLFTEYEYETKGRPCLCSYLE